PLRPVESGPAKSEPLHFADVSFVDLSRRGVCGGTAHRFATPPTECAFVCEDARGVRPSSSCDQRSSASRFCAPFSWRRTSSSTLPSSPFCPPSHDETGDKDAAQSRIELHCTLITTAQRKKQRIRQAPK